jgi:large subunit ribosomal protein L7/L12
LTTEEPKVKEKTGTEGTSKIKESKSGKGITTEDIIAAIKSMTVLDLAELVKSLQNEFGISAAPLAAGPAAAAGTAPSAEPVEAPKEEEKTEFTVILKSIGEKKIEVIKAVREVTALGLKQAKDLVEGAPQTVKEAVGKEEAATIRQKLEAAGATVELK